MIASHIRSETRVYQMDFDGRKPLLHKSISNHSHEDSDAFMWKIGKSGKNILHVLHIFQFHLTASSTQLKLNISKLAKALFGFFVGKGSYCHKYGQRVALMLPFTASQNFGLWRKFNTNGLSALHLSSSCVGRLNLPGHPFYLWRFSYLELCCISVIHSHYWHRFRYAE